MDAMKKIALEEHFLSPGLIDYWTPTISGVDATVAGKLFMRLTDFGDMRLEAMERAGVHRAVLSISGPGVQAEPDTAVAIARAQEANDFLAREIQKRSNRYLGLAHLAMQDPRAAAAELERCMGELGFCGAMINGHTNGAYLDDPSFDPFWERAAALDAPVYLHPTDPLVPAPVLSGYNALRRATWEWGFETGSHALRLVFSGLFDRFPKAKLVLGHMGETLPYLLARFDSRAKLYGVKLAKTPSQYIRENILVTVSGVFAAEPLYCAIGALGRERVMFAADYPFESAEEAGHFMDRVPLEEALRADVAYNNAAKLLGLA
jgi:2,3-dihydroxybenzoate decarboxylase